MECRHSRPRLCIRVKPGKSDSVAELRSAVQEGYPSTSLRTRSAPSRWVAVPGRFAATIDRS